MVRKWIRFLTGLVFWAAWDMAFLIKRECKIKLNSITCEWLETVFGFAGRLWFVVENECYIIFGDKCSAETKTGPSGPSGIVALVTSVPFEKCRLLGYKNPFRTSQGTLYVSATQHSRLMLCKIWGVHGCDYEECRFLGYKNPFRTSQETHYVSATESSQ
jgi:hypothetical protein